jgi:hypothetical protein
MIVRLAFTFLFAASVVLAPMQMSARTCILRDSPVQKACLPNCCANKTCCATSQKTTAPPVQPLTKSGSDQQNIATLPSTVAIAILDEPATELSVFSSVSRSAHSPPPLALICIRLI